MGRSKEHDFENPIIVIIIDSKKMCRQGRGG